MRALYVVIAAAVFVAKDAAADGAPTVYLTRGAPLAFVDASGEIHRATCGRRSSKRMGNRVGDEWTRIDGTGRAAEKVRVTESSVYDLSGCREIGTTGRPDRDDDPALYVRGPRTPSRVVACASPVTAFQAGAFVFCTKDTAGHETLRGVAGGTTLRFAHFDGAAGQWRIDRTMTTADFPTPANVAFKIVAVLDMNGDGSPEIVVHSRTSDTYGDTVYTLDRTSGSIRAVAETGGGYA